MDVTSQILVNWKKLSCKIANQRNAVLEFKFNYYTKMESDLTNERDKIVQDFQSLLKSLANTVGKDSHVNSVELLLEKTSFLHVQKKLKRVQEFLERITILLNSSRANIDELYMEIDRFHNLSGQWAVKALLGELILSFAQNGTSYMTNTYLNFLLLGPPGIGKTRYATRIAEILGKLGILLDGSVKLVTRADFVGQFVGDTAVKTTDLLNDSLEKCLVIDEAYLLGQEEKNSYGNEAIGTMVNWLDKNRGLVCIFALGYEKEMDTYFLGMNAGMARRFPFRLVLEKYNVQELRDILLYMIRSNGLTNITSIPPSVLFDSLAQQGFFANQAGDMENIASNIVRRILSSGGRELTESLLMFAVYEYIHNYKNIPARLLNSVKSVAESDIPIHMQYRIAFQTQGPECDADDGRSLRPRAPKRRAF